MRLRHGVIFRPFLCLIWNTSLGITSLLCISHPLIGIAFCSVPDDQLFHCPCLGWSLIVCVYSYCLLIDKILMALAGLDTLSIDCFLHVLALSCCWEIELVKSSLDCLIKHLLIPCGICTLAGATCICVLTWSSFLCARMDSIESCLCMLNTMREELTWKYFWAVKDYLKGIPGHLIFFHDLSHFSGKHLLS